MYFQLFGVKFGEIALWLIATHATLQSWEKLKLN